jgi:hypothetical protein
MPKLDLAPLRIQVFNYVRKQPRESTQNLRINKANRTLQNVIKSKKAKNALFERSRTFHERS